MRVEGLVVDYGALHVLGGIDLHVKKGELLSLIGPSGCGKTTFLHALAGLVERSSGTIDRAGQRHAMVFQRPNLLPWRTVLDNATFGLSCRGAVGRAERQRAEALLVSMRLGEHLGDRPHALSQGMQQRVNLARALLVEPDVLLLDEPFAALDPITRRGLWDELLARVAEHGLTALLVSHSLEEVATLSDRVVVLSDKPARVKAVVEIDLPRPRATDAESRLALQEVQARLDALLAAPSQSRSTTSVSVESDASASQ